MDLQDDLGYRSVRSSAGAIDLCDWGILCATGPDRVRYLHNMLSNDIKTLRAGEGCYATLLTNQGRMESDLYAYVSEEEIWLECPPAGKDRTLANLNKYLISDAVRLEDCTERIGILSIQGPQALETMQELMSADLQMPPLGHRVIGGHGKGWRIIRRDRTGYDGYDVWLPRAEAKNVWNQWISAGIPLVSAEALNRLRTEAGIPWFGVDMGNHNLPLEFGLKKAISLNKGCYRGQEIMARITYRGHLHRGLGGVMILQPRIPRQGTWIIADGAKVGEVTSAAYSPRLQAPLALALLKSDQLTPGKNVDLMVDKESIPGEVVALPVC